MKATIGVDFKKKVIKLEGEHKNFSLKLNIWDFGGEEKLKKKEKDPSFLPISNLIVPSHDLLTLMPPHFHYLM